MKRIMLFVGLLVFAAASSADKLEEEKVALLAVQCSPDIHPQTILSIMKTESGFHPYAIHLNGNPGTSTFSDNKEDAIALAMEYVMNDESFDAGLMQINIANLNRVGLTVAELFDPCKNIQAGALVLTQDYKNAKDNKLNDPLMGAISSYNTGSFTRGVENGYYQKVRNNADKEYLVPAINPEKMTIEATAQSVNQKSSTEEAKPAFASWDVFNDFAGRKEATKETTKEVEIFE